MSQVNDFERMITQSGIKLVKIYLSINQREQEKRFEEIKKNPLKQWKMTSLDESAKALWDQYTVYKSKMFANTDKTGTAWKIIKANKKMSARTGTIEYLLSQIPYDKNREV